MNDFIDALTHIALNNSIPFCYGCYAKAPTGCCATCSSDDLMREYPGEGVEYGVDWIIRLILREHLTAADTLRAFEESVTECYPETVKIGWIEYDTVSAIKELDPVSWNMAHGEFVDNEVADGNLVTFDDGGSYYWSRDVERLIDELGVEVEDPAD